MRFQKVLKPFRVFVGILSLSLFAWVFFDYAHRVPENVFSALTWAQFVPSLLKSVFVAFGLAAGGFILVLILTLLFGRVYCSWVCPLGMMKDFIYFLGKKLRPKRKKPRFTLPNDWLRYSILFAVVVTAVFFGNNLLLGIFDPYSSFGRFAADFGKPLFMEFNNGLHALTRSVLPGVFNPETIRPIQWEALILPGLLLTLVTGMAFFRGRLYCNTLCPVGTILGAVSHLALFKIAFKKSTCTRCGECMFACKAQCIDIKNLKVDASRCVDCYNCIGACKNNSIGYRFIFSKTKDKPVKINPETDHSKRKFIAGAMLAVPLIATTLRESGAQSNAAARAPEDRGHRRQGAQNGSGRGAGREGGDSLAHNENQSGEETYLSGRNPVVREHAVMPPGAVNLQHFTQACTACHLCVSACPTGVLRPSFLEFGFLNMLKPHMDYDVSFCNYECTTCSDVCPNGALIQFTPTEKKMTSQIGIAEFHRQNCIVEMEKTSCGACAEHCPTQAVHMVPHGIEGLTIPRVEAELCIGCGACEYACPTRPYRAIFVNGNIDHLIAEVPGGEKVEDLSREEFPF